MMHTGLIQELPAATRLSTAMLASRMADHAPQSDAIKPLMDGMALRIAAVIAGLNSAPAQVTLASIGIITVDFHKLRDETFVLRGARGALRFRVASTRDFDALLCEAAFGGTGQVSSSDPALAEERPRSHIESRLNGFVLGEICNAMGESLKQAGAGEFSREDTKSQRPARGRTPASEAYVARYLITIFSLSAEIEIQAERDALRDLLGVAGATEDAPPVHEQLGLPGLGPCMVDLAARLPREFMGFQRIVALQPGDLLELKATPNTTVEVVSGDKPVYLARLVPRAEGRMQLDIMGAAS